MSVPEISAWQVQQLRVTAFVQQNDRTKEEGWWSTLFGSPSETRTVRANEGVIQDEGPYKGGRLIMSVSPGRVDWIWVTDSMVNLENGSMLSLGTLTDISGVFRGLMNAWFDLASPFVRLAFGVVLHQPVASKQDGYRLLQGYLPAVRISPESSSDFVYQINRPIKSKVSPDYLLNRLNKWVTLRAIVEAGQGNKPAVRHKYTAVRLEVDVNTPEDSTTVITKEMNQALLLELIGVAQDIAGKGDQPS